MTALFSDRRGTRNVVFAVLCAGGAAALLPGWAGTGDGGVVPGAPVQPAAEPAGPTVVTVRPERRRLVIRFDQPGVVEPIMQADLYARVAGYVTRVAVDIGDQVAAEAVLLEIDVPELAQEHRCKLALEEQARSELEKAAVQVGAAEAALDRHAARTALARAEVRRAEAEVRHAVEELDRFQRLASERAITRQVVREKDLRLESLRAAEASATARLEAEAAERTLLLAAIDESRAEQKICEARVRVAEAEREKTQVLLESTRVRAPFEGTITARNVDVGAYVRTPASDLSAPIFTLVRNDRMRVTFQVPEREVAAIQPGCVGSIRFDALSPEPIVGCVARLSRSLDARSRTMRVEMDVDNADGRLYPGMYGRASIVLREVHGALTLPSLAVETFEGTPSVLAVDADNLVRRVPVTIDHDDGRIMHVATGLTGDERVIIGNRSEATVGQRVVVHESTPLGNLAGLAP